MKSIKQRHKYGCGTACIAMLTGLSYRKTERLLVKEFSNIRLGMTNIQISSFLNKLLIGTQENIKLSILNKPLQKLVKEAYANSYQDIMFIKQHKQIISLKSNAILSIKNKNDTFHAVVWDVKGKRILDPGRIAFPIDWYQERLYSIITTKVNNKC